MPNFLSLAARTGGVAAALLCCFAGAAASAREPQVTRPNVIFMLADDLGYGDLGCYGQKRIQTPHLDRLAREGMRFTDFYAGSTVCAPSRCVLMTGYHTGHCLIRGNARVPLRPNDKTVAEVFQNAGYATTLCGKWGLGEESSTGIPTRQGFDHFFGYLNQHHAHNYYPAYLFRNEEHVPLKNVVPGGGEFGVGVASEKIEYGPDWITAEALDWIEKQHAKPFFVYYAPTLPHANNEAGKHGMEVPDFGPYADTDWPEQQKAHAAMVSKLDTDVGKLLALLERLKIAENTLIFFASDNGPHSEGGNDPDFNDSNGPLKGIKRSLHEGGIRVPFMARWPGKIKAGTTSDFIGGFQDFLPTMADLLGASSEVPSDADGVSILPTLLGETDKQQSHDYLYWAFYERGGAQAARIGPWKAIQQPLDSPVRLYDLSNDIGEEHNLAAAQPEVVHQLEGHMQAAYEPTELWQFPKVPAPSVGKAKGTR